MKKLVKETLNEIGPIAYPGGEFGPDERARREGTRNQAFIIEELAPHINTLKEKIKTLGGSTHDSDWKKALISMLKVTHDLEDKMFKADNELGIIPLK